MIFLLLIIVNQKHITPYDNLKIPLIFITIILLLSLLLFFLFYMCITADLLLKDKLGASAVDYIYNKQLTYCGMILRAHLRSNDQQTTPTNTQR